MSILDTTFQYYPSNVHIIKALGTLNLRDLLNSIKNPKIQIQNVFLQIQKATEDGDLKLKDKLKSEKLFYFTPSVKTNCLGRGYENVLEYNELMVVEFDKVDFAEELKHYIFNTIKSVIAAFTSPSKKGCKFIVKIPKPKNAEEYKAYFCGLAAYLDKIQGFDKANFNPVLPLFLSWDPDILIRENPSTWTRQGEKIDSFKPLIELDQSLLKPKGRVTDKEQKYITEKIKRMFNSITDNGHGQVITFSLIVGGHISAGYISSSEAEWLVENCIEQNSYLSKNTKGYKKTSKQFLQQGMTSPVYLTPDEKRRVQ
jgi:hypothetical protein